MEVERDSTTPEARKPRCKLVGSDGNVYAIIGHVAKALKADGGRRTEHASGPSAR